MSDRIIQSNKEELYASCIKRKMEGWRLAQICAVTINDGFEMSYTFVKDLDMDTLRICLKEDEPISSITQIYPCAFYRKMKQLNYLVSRLKILLWTINTNYIV